MALATLKSLSNSPPALVAIAAALLFAAFIASSVNIASWSPSVPGYRQVGIWELRSDQFAKTLNGQQVWLTGGVMWFDKLALSFQGDHPNDSPYVELKLAQASAMQLPQTRQPFSPYGVLHVVRQDEDRLQLSLDITGETDHGLIPQPSSLAANALKIAALCVLICAALAPLKHSLSRRHEYRFPPGCCKICGYDLRATTTRCPECGHQPAARVTV